MLHCFWVCSSNKSLQHGSKYKSGFLFGIFRTNYFLLYKSLRRFLILTAKTALRREEGKQLISAGSQINNHIKYKDKDLSQRGNNKEQNFLSGLNWTVYSTLMNITVGQTEVKWDEAKSNQKKHADLTECWTMTSHPRVVYKRRETITELPLYYSGQLLKKHNKDKVRTKTGGL